MVKWRKLNSYLRDVAFDDKAAFSCGFDLFDRHPRGPFDKLKAIGGYIKHCKVGDDAFDDPDTSQRECAFFQKLGFSLGVGVHHSYDDVAR